MRNSFCLALILLLIGFGYPQEWKAVVLKAKTVEAGRSGQLTIKLISGDTLNVPETDWSESWSEAVDDALKKQELERSARATAEPPSDETAAAMIRARCAAKWPDDYSMRKYCEDQQYEALRALRARKMEGALSKIRAQCAKKWSEDYTMRDYCEKQQLEALRALNYQMVNPGIEEMSAQELKVLNTELHMTILQFHEMRIRDLKHQFLQDHLTEAMQPVQNMMKEIDRIVEGYSEHTSESISGSSSN